LIFRRRREGTDDADSAAADEGFLELPSTRSRGPWDRAEATFDANDDSYLDLGSLIVPGGPDLELQLQVDEATGALAAVVLATSDSGLEVRAFAAPRSGGIWDDVRREIAGEASRFGGTATEQDGEFGPELHLVVSVQAPDGQAVTQPTRVVGVEGPRWLLRGTFFGESAVRPDPEGILETAFRSVIVVRGDGAMAPGEQLPLRMPPDLELSGDFPADR
jgi:hypothetical protein